MAAAPTLAQLFGGARLEALSDVRELLDRARREGVVYHASPQDWRDEILYFLLPDRFSDEKDRPLLTRAEITALRKKVAHPTNWKKWADSGLRWQGGTLAGIVKRLPYLQELGVSAVWIGPVFKQRAREDTFHGYGVQDFLEVDPRFGTRKELIELVAAAHARGIRVILDIIVNHSGDNWRYLPPGKALKDTQNQPPFRPFPDFYGNPNDEVTRDYRLAWRNEQGVAFTTEADKLASAEDGVWPRELQDPRHYTRAGKGDLGAGDIADPHGENKRTDFFTLKDFALDGPGTLAFLADCFKYWIALSDCDGFRIDTVKHISIDEARNFCGAVREFADTLNKRNFLLVGEIAGGDFFQDFVLDRLAVLQRNLSAALDIGTARTSLTNVGKGFAPGDRYLGTFVADAEGFGSHRAVGNRHVSILDDHDHVVGEKLRFSAGIDDDSPVKDHQVVAPTAIQLFTLGIPCIYYGTEQALAGPPKSQVQFLLGEGYNDPSNFGDRYLRECLFGPDHPRAKHTRSLAEQLSGVDKDLPGFGPFGVAGKHCFDTTSPAFVRLAALCRVRQARPVLRIGRQYARQIRVPGGTFRLPEAGELVAWSRIIDNQEALCIVNVNGATSQRADVIVAAELWDARTRLTVIANTKQAATPALAKYDGPHPVGSTLPVQVQDGSAFVTLQEIPPGEVVILIKEP
jgi:glycosidase